MRGKYLIVPLAIAVALTFLAAMFVQPAALASSSQQADHLRAARRGPASPAAKQARKPKLIASGVIVNGELLHGRKIDSFSYSDDRYEIRIKNRDFYFRDYSVVVTPIGDDPLIATYSSLSGELLLVYLTAPDGTRVEGSFAFQVFRY